jgi:hypothetical protein
MHRKQALHCRNSSVDLAESHPRHTRPSTQSPSSFFSVHVAFLLLLLLANLSPLTFTLKLPNHDSSPFTSSVHPPSSVDSALQTDFRELQDKRLTDSTFGSVSAFDSSHLRRSLDLPDRHLRRNVARYTTSGGDSVGRLEADTSNDLLKSADSPPPITVLTTGPVSTSAPPMSTTGSAVTPVERPFNDKDNLLNEQEVDRNQVNSRIKDTIEWNEPSIASNQTNRSRPEKQFDLAKFDFDHVSTPYVISLWIIIVGLAKIGMNIRSHYFRSTSASSRLRLLFARRLSLLPVRSHLTVCTRLAFVVVQLKSHLNQQSTQITDRKC